MFFKSNLVIFSALLILCGQAEARMGTETGNGGDMCENRIKIIRDDIVTWIKNSGSSYLKLPEGIAVTQYNSAMLEAAASTEISCTDTKIFVRGVEKTCMNFFDDKKKPQIICNNSRFMQTESSEQYILTHHEYAGVSGLESNVGAESNYDISNQISAYLENKVVKKLVVKPAEAGASSLCPAPRGKAAALFSIINDPQQSQSDLEAFLNQNIVGFDALNEWCETPLHAAIGARKLSEYKLLSKMMGVVDVNMIFRPDALGAANISLYEYAIRFGDMEAIRFLRSQGGKLSRGLTPLMVVSETRALSFIEKVYNENPKALKAKDESGRTAFHYALERNTPDVIRFFLSKGERLDGNNNPEALSIAAKSNSAEVVELLIKAGARINPGDGKISPLMYSTYNMVDVTELLLDAGADLHYRDADGLTALHWAILGCSSKGVYACTAALFLLEAGSDPNNKAKHWNTSILIHAARLAPLEVLQALVAAGADKNNYNNINQTAYEIASQNKRSPEVLALLKPSKCLPLPNYWCL